MGRGESGQAAGIELSGPRSRAMCRSFATARVACSPASIDQERKFLSALEAVRGWRINPVRRKLVLLGALGDALVVFARM